MSASHRIGRVFVELDLDPDRYMKSQQRLYKDATQTSLNIEKNFKNLGIRSAAEMDLMRQKVENSYNMIAHSAKATANDILRAEKAKNDQLKKLDEMQYGRQVSMIGKLKTHWLGMTAAVYGSIRMVTGAFGLMERAAQAEQQRRAFENMAKSYGASGKQILADLKRVSDGTISTMEMVEKAGTAMMLGINPEQISGLMAIARATSRQTGQSVTQAFDNISLAVGRQSKMILDNLGIIVSVEKANEAYATSLGKTVEQLSDYEKKQAFLNETVKVGQDLMRRLGDQQDTNYDKMQRLRATIENAKIWMGQAFTRVVLGATSAFQLLSSGATSVAAGLAKLNEWAMRSKAYITIGKDKRAALRAQADEAQATYEALKSSAEDLAGRAYKNFAAATASADDFQAAMVPASSTASEAAKASADLATEWGKTAKALNLDIHKTGLSDFEQKLIDIEAKAIDLKEKFAGVADAAKTINQWAMAATEEAVTKAAQSDYDQWRKNEEQKRKETEETIKRQQAAEEQLLSDKMELYKDLTGFEDEYRKVQLEWIEKIRKAEIEATGDVTAANKKAAEAIAKVDQASFEAKAKQVDQALGDMATTFSTIGNMYDKNSDEYAKMQEAAKVMMVAQQGVAVANAVAAIANQGLGNPYEAFARIAAMTAAMAGLLASAGLSFSGGGASAPAARTPQSTALGSDDQSRSTERIWELLEDTYSMEYRELSGIHGAVKDLNANITGLVTSIVRTGGTGEFAAGFNYATPSSMGSMMDDVFGTAYETAFNTLTFGMLEGLGSTIGNFVGGLMGSVGSAIFGGDVSSAVTSSGISFGRGTVRNMSAGLNMPAREYADVVTKVDGGWFGSDDYYYNTYFNELDKSTQALFSKVFANISDTLIFLAEGLGRDVNRVLDYEFKAGKINLKGLNAEEINTKLTEYFSTIGDKAVQKLFGSLVSGYQQVGEGLMETATRLVIDKAVVLDTLDMTNQAFRGSTKQIIAFSESVIQMAGDLEKFRDSAEAYYSAFFTEAEQAKRIKSQLKSVFTDLAVGPLPKTREGFRDVVEGLNLTTEAGAQAYVALMGVAESADAYYSYMEDAAEKSEAAAKAAAEAAAAAARAMDTAVDMFEHINPSAVSFADTLAQIAGSMDDLNSAMQTYYDAFFTDAEKQARLKSDLSSGLGAYGLDLPGAREDYRQMVEGLNLTTAAGQEAYVALMQMSGMANQYYTYLENAAAASAAAANAARAAINPADYATSLDYQRALAAIPTIPTYASGGYFPGGVRIVGESGPELEYTAPSYIVKNTDTRRLLNMDDVKQAIFELRQEVHAGNLAISRFTQKTFNTLDKWDAEGIPPERD